MTAATRTPAAAPAQRMLEAMQLHVQGRLDEAEAAYASLLAELPQQPDILHSLGVIRMQRQQWLAAMEYFARALAADPHHERTLKQITPVLSHLAPDERMMQLEAMRQKGVRNETVYHSYARLLKDTGHFERALEICNEAVRAFPKSGSLFKLRGSVNMTLGRYTDAIADMSQNIAFAPDDYHAYIARGTARLLISDCSDGFNDYAAVTQHEIKARGMTFAMPEWKGEKLAGKHILIWCCQGIGDIVMFASLLPWVLEQGARVTLTLYPKLAPLFARSFPQVRIVPHASDIGTFHADCQYHSPIERLMGYVLPHYTPAGHKPFLKADPERSRALRLQYESVAKGRRLIGISWQTTNQDTFSQRNIPLEAWAPLFSLPGLQFVSLQYGDHAAAIDAVNKAFPGKLHVDPQIDIYGDTDALCAQITAMDEVVSIQNATVHLAGALGIPTTLMLSAASDWRWGLKRTDSRWYESVHIERQQNLLDWAPVIASVRGRLSKKGSA